MSKHREKADRKEQVKAMFEQGRDPDEIAQAMKISVYTVRVYLQELGLDYKQTEKLSSFDRLNSAVKLTDIALFKNRLRIGEEVTVIVEREDGHNVYRQPRRARIIDIYPNIVLTDRGCYQVKELYLWSGISG